MNSGVNALGQGNRANATIGRALQLVDAQRRRRPARRGRPRHARQPRQVHVLLRRGRSRLAVGAAARRARARAEHVARSRCSPAKACAASSISSPRTRIARPLVRRLPAHRRPPEDRDRVGRDARRLARARPRVPRGRLVEGPSARGARWACCRSRRGDDRARAPAASPRGCRRASAGTTLPKFRDGGLLIVHAGGGAGLFSAIIGGWASGASAASRSPGRSAHERTGLLDPTSERSRDHPRARAATRRRSTGATIGLLDISKPRGNVFLDRLEELLARARACGSSASRSRRSRSRPRSTCATRSSTKCDVVIEALAD